MRAAVFCISLNLFNRCLRRPYNKEVQLSSLELINACTKIWEVSSLKSFLILAIYMFLKWQETQILLISSVKSRLIYNHPQISGGRFGLDPLFNHLDKLQRRPAKRFWADENKFSFILTEFKTIVHHPTMNVIYTAFDTTLSQREIIATVTYVQPSIIYTI